VEQLTRIEPIPTKSSNSGNRLAQLVEQLTRIESIPTKNSILKFYHLAIGISDDDRTHFLQKNSNFGNRLGKSTALPVEQLTRIEPIPTKSSNSGKKLAQPVAQLTRIEPIPTRSSNCGNKSCNSTISPVE
jgi:hypothetical protein